jgi:hypothetical protein
MTVLTPANAFPGIPAPQHLSGKTSVQNFIYPGAVQPQSTTPKVLSYTNAFLGIQVPQHLSGKTKVQSFIFPGALQPTGASAPTTGPIPRMFIPIPTWEY